MLLSVAYTVTDNKARRSHSQNFLLTNCNFLNLDVVNAEMPRNARETFYRNAIDL